MLRSFVVLLFPLSPFRPFFFFPYFHFFKFSSFHGAFFSGCTFFMVRSLHVANFLYSYVKKLFNLHYFQVALCSCSTPLLDFLMLNVLHCCICSSCSFAMLYFFLVARFSYGTLFILMLYSFSFEPFRIFQVIIFSGCTLSMLQLFHTELFNVALF